MSPALAFVVALAAQVAPPSPKPPVLAEERILLETTHGDLVIALYPVLAPQHVAQILRLVRLGVYDGTTFHRIEDNFVAQLGVPAERETPLSPEQRAAIERIPAEFNRQRHLRGVVTMARFDDDIDSATTSFSIMLGQGRNLDGRYTVFGRLERGFDTLERIERVDKKGSRPLRRVTVRKATVIGPPPAAEGLALHPIGWAIAFGGLVASVLARRVRTPHVRSAAMLLMLGGVGIVVAATLWARSQQPGWVGLLVFVFMVGTFRYLATFESSPARPRA